MGVYLQFEGCQTVIYPQAMGTENPIQETNNKQFMDDMKNHIHFVVLLHKKAYSSAARVWDAEASKQHLNAATEHLKTFNHKMIILTKR